MCDHHIAPGRHGLTHWGRDKWMPFRRRHFQCIFLNENVWIPISIQFQFNSKQFIASYSANMNISLKFVPQGPINNIPALVQIMAWRRPGDKPLPEPMVVSLPMHICIDRPQWVNGLNRLQWFACLSWQGSRLRVSCHGNNIPPGAPQIEHSLAYWYQGPFLLRWINFNPSMNK